MSEMISGGDWQKVVHDAWNAMADQYDAMAGTRDDYYRTDVIGPGLLSACGDVSGLKVLDLGCGQGYFSRLLAQGRATVVGIDISEQLINHAVRRERASPLGIEYLVLDAADAAGRWAPASFDLVVSCIALQNMPEASRALRSAATLMKPAGRAVFLIEHPTNTTATRVWERDERGNKIALRIDRYFDTGPRIVSWPMSNPSGERRQFRFPSWSRTLEEWSELFSSADLLIARIREPRPTAVQVEQCPDLDDCFRIPYFLIFDLVQRR